MRRALLLLPLLALTMSACGSKAKNEAALANETMGGDSNTMAEAEADTNAALAAGNMVDYSNAMTLSEGNQSGAGSSDEDSD